MPVAGDMVENGKHFMEEDEEDVVAEEDQDVEVEEQDTEEQHVNASASEMLSAVNSGNSSVRAPVVKRMKPTGRAPSRGEDRFPSKGTSSRAKRATQGVPAKKLGDGF